MSLETNELVSTNTVAAKKRYQADLGRIKTVVLATVASAVILDRLTPMALHDGTNNWHPWTQGVSANNLGIIKGFLINGELSGPGDDGVVQTSATDEVHGVIMLAGQFHVDDVALFASNTLAQVKTAIEGSELSHVFQIQGMDNDSYI